MQNLNQLLTRLIDANIDFVIIGGFAGIVHGSSLVTRDLDLCTILSSENIEKIRKVLGDLNPRHRMTPQKLKFLEIPPAGQDLNNLYLETELGIVDFLSMVPGVGDFEKVKSEAEEYELLGHRIKVMSLDQLIQAKSSTKRERDRRAVEELKVIKAQRDIK